MSRSTSASNRSHSRQRLLMGVFGVTVVFAIASFCFVGFQVVMREPREIPAGFTDDYVNNVPQRFAVDKLEVSSWAKQRPEVSEDIIFVMRDQDGVWWAFLGLDMRTGCFLNWNSSEQLFVSPGDPKCLSSRYTPDGRYLDSFESSDPPKPMARLRVEIRDSRVFVVDSLVPRSNP